MTQISTDLTLALGFIILTGAMLMPALVVMTRLAVLAGKLAARYGALATIAHVRHKAIEWLIAAALAALGLGLATPVPAAERLDGKPAAVALAVTEPAAMTETPIDQTIDDLMRMIRGARKPLPVWALDIAERAWGTWQTYRNGQKVEEIGRTVEKVLRTVDGIRREVEAGRKLDDARYRFVRETLDAHQSALDALAGRVDDLERFTRERLEAHARHLAEVARMSEANRKLAAANAEKARENERLSRANTSVIRRKSCGYRGYWNVAAQRCDRK
jgi:hypothetical protein